MAKLRMKNYLFLLSNMKNFFADLIDFIPKIVAGLFLGYLIFLALKGLGF
ncbi:MAG: hypothetical protein Q7S66_05250 [bacterium]|nr:hypothetical protein [bacterium]